MKMTRTLFAAAIVAALVVPAVAAEDSHSTPQPPRQKWSFAGPFGKFDQAQLQRGFRVYKEVCANCHSMSLISFRNLAEPGGVGYTPAQVAALAAEYKVQDGPNDAGDMFERPGRPADRFPKPFPNDNAARAANGGALPPDMSVLAKARTYERGFPWFVFDIFTQYQEQALDYIHAVLMGYEEMPQGMTMPPGASYNKYYPGHAIGMPAPISDGQVTYEDGTPTTVDQYGKDVAAFLMWAAEPKMMERKRLGFQVMIFLLVLTGLLYFTKNKVWSSVH